MLNATSLRIAGSSLLLLLTSCGLTLPPYIGLSVINFYEDQPELGVACSGGMKVAIKAGSLHFEALVGDSGEDQRIDFPEDVPAGTPAVLEVWCYDDSQQDAGYIKISEPLKPASNADMVISMRRDASGREGCTRGQEEIAPVPCVRSNML